jgi:hypothetical protein
MTEIDAKLMSTELQDSPIRSDEPRTSFILPWRIQPDGSQTQQEAYSCSCGCGCKKGRALAARMAKDASALVKVLQGVEAYVQSLKKEAAKPKAAKSKKKRKKK